MTQHRDVPARTLRWARRRARRLALATSVGGAAVSLLGAGVLPVNADDQGSVRLIQNGSGSGTEYVVNNGSGPNSDTLQCLRDHGAVVRRGGGGQMQIMVRNNNSDAIQACDLSVSDS